MTHLTFHYIKHYCNKNVYTLKTILIAKNTEYDEISLI